MIEIGYWDIRGLAGFLRLLALHASAEYKNTLYTLTPNGDGTFSNDWVAAKQELLKKHAFINLPYLVDGDILLTQSTAILNHLARKYKLDGDNETEKLRNEEVLYQAVDLKNEVTGPCYKPKAVSEPVLQESLETVFPKFLNQFSAYKTTNGTKFMAADRPLSCDIYLFEVLTAIAYLAKDFGKANYLDAFPVMKAYYESIDALPAVQKYKDCGDYYMPFNNKIASYGADRL